MICFTNFHFFRHFSSSSSSSSSSFFDFSFCFFCFFCSRERERAVTKNFFLMSHERKKILRFIIRFTHTHTLTNQKRSRREEEEEEEEEEVHQNVSIWRRRQRKQIVFVRSAIQSLPGLVHRPLGVGQRGQNHPTTERVGQIVATRRLGFPDVVQH